MNRTRWSAMLARMVARHSALLACSKRPAWHQLSGGTAAMPRPRSGCRDHAAGVPGRRPSAFWVGCAPTRCPRRVRAARLRRRPGPPPLGQPRVRRCGAGRAGRRPARRHGRRHRKLAGAGPRRLTRGPASRPARPSSRSTPARGLGTAAHRLLVDHLFRYTTAHRLDALTNTSNHAEQRVLERAGFQRRESCAASCSATATGGTT